MSKCSKCGSPCCIMNSVPWIIATAMFWCGWIIVALMGISSILDWWSGG